MNVNYMVYVVKYFSIYNNQNLFFVIFTLKTLNIEIREMLPPFKKLKIKKRFGFCTGLAICEVI